LRSRWILRNRVLSWSVPRAHFNFCVPAVRPVWWLRTLWWRNLWRFFRRHNWSIRRLSLWSRRILRNRVLSWSVPRPHFNFSVPAVRPVWWLRTLWWRNLWRFFRSHNWSIRRLSLWVRRILRNRVLSWSVPRPRFNFSVPTVRPLCWLRNFLGAITDLFGGCPCESGEFCPIACFNDQCLDPTSTSVCQPCDLCED